VPRPPIPPLDPSTIPPLKAPPKDPSADHGGLNAPSGPAPSKSGGKKDGDDNSDDNGADDNNGESGSAKKGAGGEPELMPFAPEGDDEGETGDDDAR
jgi:hypothetical protein